MSYCNQITTLLLDSSFLPYGFLSGKSTFLHLVKNTIKCFDAEENLIEDNNLWFKNQGITFYDDQPFLTSKDRVWLIPTVAVLKTKTHGKKHKIPKTLSLTKLCTIFDFTCQICYEKFDKDKLTIEHIYPRSKGGTKSIDNITLTCHSCNQNKRDMYPFYNKKNMEIKTVPLPLPVIPNKFTKIRPEWNKFFVYRKIK